MQVICEAFSAGDAEGAGRPAIPAEDHEDRCSATVFPEAIAQGPEKGTQLFSPISHRPKRNWRRYDVRWRGASCSARRPGRPGARPSPSDARYGDILSEA